MNECWQHFCQQCPEMDVLFLMGDLIDGQQKKSQGIPLFTTHLREQVDGATELLRPIAEKAETIYRTEGTPYHDDFHDPLALLDAELGVKRTFQIGDFVIGDRVLNVAHHPMGGATMYSGTKLDREQLWAKRSASAKKVPDPTWIVRGHHHDFSTFHREDVSVASCPAWQLPTAWAKKTNYWKFQVTIGALFLVADEIQPKALRDPSGYRFARMSYESPKTREEELW